jgi:outer membrane protein OmpA-like peptidoglycan-associated protein
MCRRQLLIGITICCVTASFLPVPYVKAEASPLIEQHADVRRQVGIAQENADRAALTALISEKQAVRARKKSSSGHLLEDEREGAERKASKTAQGVVLTVGDVLFAPDQSEPTTATIRNLSPLVTLLKEQPQKRIHIEGYADSTGPEAYNLALSQRRADTVRDSRAAREPTGGNSCAAVR